MASGLVQGQGILDWYGQNHGSLVNSLGLNPAWVQDISGQNPFDSFTAHDANKTILQQELLRIFTENVGVSESYRPSDALGWNTELNDYRLEQVINAYAGDTILPGQVDVQQGMALLNEWSDTLTLIESSVDALTYAFANGIIVNPSGENSLYLPDGSTLDGATILPFIDADATIADPNSGAMIPAQLYAQTYLADLPSLQSFGQITTEFSTWTRQTLGIDLSYYFIAHTGNVDQLYSGATVGTVAAEQVRVFDTLAIFDALADGAELAGGSARGVASADFQLFLLTNMYPDELGNPPIIPDAWYTSVELTALQDDLRSILFDAFGDLDSNATNAGRWSDLAADRQKVVSAYVMGTDDARAFYAFQIAIIDQDIDALEGEMIRRMTAALDGDPLVQTQLDAARSLFDTAQSRADNLALTIDVYGGVRTDQPILRADLPVSEGNLIDLRWDADPVNGEAPFDLDTIYNNGDTESGWRSVSSVELFNQLLPALAEELGKGVVISEFDTIFDLDTALRAQADGDAFVDGVETLALDIANHNAQILQYEVVRLAYLRTDPLERTETWSAQDQRLQVSQAVSQAGALIETRLADLGLSETFLQTGFDIPQLGGGTGGGGGEGTQFGFVPPADTLLTDVETAALRYDLAELPGLVALQGFLGLDGVMPADWGTDTRADIKDKLETGLTLITLPDGSATTFSATWLDKVSTAVQQYNNAVTAYEKSLNCALLNGTPAQTALDAAADLKVTVDVAYAGVLADIQSEDGGSGDAVPAAIDLLGDTYGDILDADALASKEVNGKSLLRQVAFEPYIPFLDGTQTDTVIRYFDPKTGTMQEAAPDFSAVDPATPGTPPPQQTLDIGVFNDPTRQSALSDLGQGYAAASDLTRISSTPDVTFDFNDALGRTNKILAGGDLGFSLIGVGGLVAQLADGADPLTVATLANYTLSGLTLAVADFMDAVYEDATQVGKYAALSERATRSGRRKRPHRNQPGGL